jgi:hypothetical protein
MPTRIAKTKDGIRRLNTKIWQGDGYFQVCLYETVVYDEQKEKITLRSGGWNTPTTTSRINQALSHRGIAGGVNIKNGHLHYNGKPFINGEYIIEK